MTSRFKGGPLALIAAGAGLLLVSRKFMQPKRFDLSGRVVLITGSSRGLGLALAEEFARHDARIVLTAHEEDELERARLHIAHLGAEVLAIPCDVTRHLEVQSLVDKVTAHYGHIDVLVNNAGIITVGPLQAQTLDDFQDSIAKGKHEAEYTWFSLAATLPFTSMSARRAAQQIVRAMQHHSSQVVITFQAKLLIASTPYTQV